MIQEAVRGSLKAQPEANTRDSWSQAAGLALAHILRFAGVTCAKQQLVSVFAYC